MTDRIDALLAEIAAETVTPSSSVARLVFALDATASREPTWDIASQLQAEMFREVTAIGGLEVQLVYFRGLVGVNAECKASGWVGSSLTLARLMAKIRCESGYTQIYRVLEHALRASNQQRIGALVFVGDACEEAHDSRDRLMPLASALGAAGVPAFMFQEGHDHTAKARFEEIARLTHGAYHRFDQGSARLLAELLRAVAAFASGGVAALEKQGTAAARLLLGQVR